MQNTTQAMEWPQNQNWKLLYCKIQCKQMEWLQQKLEAIVLQNTITVTANV